MASHRSLSAPPSYAVSSLPIISTMKSGLEYCRTHNLQKKNRAGFTPLHLAAASGQLGAVAALVDVGARNGDAKDAVRAASVLNFALVFGCACHS